MNTAPSSPAPDFAGREILVCVCGGIAAYKICEVVSRLVQAGAGVTVAMTRAARRFIGPATFEALTTRRVLTGLWSAGQIADSPHIRATAALELTLVAPATANMLGKVAGGLADDVVSTLILSSPPPVLFAPAMNDRMWQNAIVEANVRKLRDAGYAFVGPGVGWLACRSVGPGRMADPPDILHAATTLLSPSLP